MTTIEERIAAQQLRREALVDCDDVTTRQPLDVVVERIVLAFQRVENHVLHAEQHADRASAKRLRELTENERAARANARALVRKALVFAHHWGAGPVCTKCEIEQRLGGCRCEIAANE